MGRSGLLGLGDRERLAHDLGHDLRTRHARVPFDYRAQDRDQIYVLVRLLVHSFEVGLTGQGDQRGAVQESVGNCRDEVGRTRPQRAQADPSPSCQPAVGVGHVCAALFVSYRHEPNGGVGQRLAQVERLLARDAEHVADALGLQALHKHVGCPACAHCSRNLTGGSPRPILVHMATTWVLDTETKGTGANMVPLERVTKRSSAPAHRFVLPERRSPHKKPPKPRTFRQFRIVDVMTRRELLEAGSARDAVEALRSVRSIVDVNLYLWDEERERWLMLPFEEQRTMLDLARTDA